MFHIAPLTSERIREGVLFEISDALNAAFTQSAAAITERGLRGDPEEMIIHFDNPSISPSFWNNHGEDVQDVLYFNSAAKDAVERADIKLNFTGTTDELPEGRGLMSRMPRYINLR